jgi:transposase-like protein
LATRLFIEEVLKYCDGTPTFAVDSAPWLAGVLKELGLRYNVESFRR